MARITRSAAAAAAATVAAPRPIKCDDIVGASAPKRPAPKQQTGPVAKKPKTSAVKTEAAANKLEKLEEADALLSSIPAAPGPTKTTSPGKADDALASRKLKQYYGGDDAKPSGRGPFPDFARPTPAECKRAHRILASLHGPRRRPSKPRTAGPTNRAGCGDAPSVLDALVRTILSQNTSDVNSSRAKLSMDRAYDGHDNWPAVVAGGLARLEEAIRCGGLSVVKSRVIMSILETCKERYGEYSLDHLRERSNEDAMREMLAFKGVGPKTASCVLLFCLARESFAVDTHVHRLTGILGWRPAKASREEAHLHLDARIPDEDKYGLHVLLIAHGKRCPECKAGGRSLGKCELRRAFRSGSNVELEDDHVSGKVEDTDDEGSTGVSVKSEQE